MEFIIFWIFLSVLVGVFASSKKRSGVGWFFLSLIISPLITFIILLVAGSPQGILKKCPKCAEEVKAEAQVCRFCGYEFSVKEEVPLSPEEIIKNDLQEQHEKYRIKFNELAAEIYKAKTKEEKKEIERQRKEIEIKIDQLGLKI
jgi:hypothetical protein